MDTSELLNSQSSAPKLTSAVQEKIDRLGLCTVAHAEQLVQPLIVQNAELSLENQSLRQSVARLEQQVEELLKKAEEYQKYEVDIHNDLKQVREHVASVDAKAREISELRSLAFGVWDVLYDLVVPIGNFAESLVKAKEAYRSLSPKVRSRTADKEDLTKFLGEHRNNQRRWRDRSIGFKD